MKRCPGCGETKPPEAFGGGKGQARCKDCRRAYREANPEKERERKKLWVAKNQERVRAKKRAEYLADREQVIRRVREQYNARREEILSERRAKYEADPTVRLAANRARQALTSGAASAELVRREIVYERDGGICGICGTAVDPKRWHLDHKTPLILGGSHSYENVHVTHPECNLRKGVRPLEAQVA